MPLFLVEKKFAERLEMDRESVAESTKVNQAVGIEWIYSFLSADQRKTYCLYEAPSAEAIREAARRLGVSPEAIVEVTRVGPQDYAPAPTAAEA